MEKHSRGFTLIELSISIVIIGLIVAAIIGGQQIIHQAKVRNTITDLQNIQRDITSFKLKYNALPGDLKNASSYWAGANDGNGNRRFNNNPVVSCVGADREGCNVYEHMYLSGIWSDVGSSVTDINQTRKSALGGYFIFHSLANIYKPHGEFTAVVITGDQGAADLWDNVVSARDNHNIDNKIDDGIPNRGIVQGFRWAIESDSCALQADGTEANTGYQGDPGSYDVADNGLCSLSFKL